MLEKFKKFIDDKKLFTPKQRLLLAVSGGIDSIVLAELCFKAGFDFGIAHCNFGLRNAESDGDEFFVKELAKRVNVPFYTTRFDTQKFADEEQVSVQMAARELRYKWFEEIRKKNKYDFICIAHHKDDEIETFFINLVRGTGISGLHGISAKKNKIIRPLLFTTRAEIEKFGASEKLQYREDSSNASDKYIRNKLRHKVIPVLKEINPSLENTISSDIQRLQEVEQVYLQTVAEKTKKFLTIKKAGAEIDLGKLLKLNPVSVYLYESLKEYGFNESVCKNILTTVQEKGSGQLFISSTHILVRDRNKLIIVPIKKSHADKTYLIKKSDKTISDPLDMLIEKVPGSRFTSIPKLNHIACVDYDKLKFPLTIRRWKEGDSFRPLGMKFNKKLSDFFIDNKFSIVDKKDVWLLISGNEIVWIIGHRLDDRYKIIPATKKVCIFKLT